jgi:hypothetical protein
MAAPHEFINNTRSGMAGGSNDCDLHDDLDTGF